MFGHVGIVWDAAYRTDLIVVFVSRLVWPYQDDQGEPVPHGTRLVHADFKRLDSKDEFLNDTLIDFELG